MPESVTRFLAGLSTPALIALVTVAALQLLVQAWAIVDLLRRDSVRFQKKWIWLLIILGGSLLGPVIYAALGRIPSVGGGDPEVPAAARDRIEAGVANLYRDRDPK